MALEEKEFKKEEEYLAKTVSAVQNRMFKLDGYIKDQVKDVTEFKRHLSEDALDIDAEELVETHNKVNNLVDFTSAQMREAYMLEKAKTSPYFGRIDFKATGDNEALQVYVGLLAIEDAGEYYVFDWRAPISELFYESGIGAASYRAPKGKIKGEVVLKRQFVVKNAKLEQAYEVDLNIGDEFLRDILAIQKDTSNLHSIASSIQAEQNKIIRNTADDFLIVQGMAGSGKTTVALHRVAYMIYREKNLDSSNILIFSPNMAFANYISTVLPELGEDNTRSATFVKFIKRVLKTSADVESQDEFAERFAKLKDADKSIVMQKLDTAIEEKVDEFLTRYCRKLRFEGDLEVGSNTITERELNNMLHENCVTGRILERIDNIAENISLQAGIVAPKALSSLRDNIVGRLNNSIRLIDIYNEFNKDTFGAGEITDRIKFEDAVLLCVMKAKIQSIIVKMDIHHIVIDEAQDYPLLFLNFLVGIFPRAKFTVLGDVLQQTLPGELNVLVALCKAHAERAKYVTLEKTYRSSEEIVQYTSKLLKKDEHNAFRLKNNRPVETRELAQLKDKVVDDIRTLAKLGDKKIGIIAGSVARAKAIYKMLKPKLGLNLGLVSDNDEATLAPVVVIPALLAKGLEFDSVVVVCEDMLEQNLNLLYIACTRAIHGLVIYGKQRGV